MLVGQHVGPFFIEKELGSGAMGTVYRGRYTKSGKVVAIKVMAPGLGTSGGHAAERFEREAEILRQLKHENIVGLFGAGKTHGTRYFAMEYIEGESLDKVLARRGRIDWEEVVDLGRQLCAALQHAHEKGIIHRDLKPSNLMVLRDGTLKLTDFGIAKDVDLTALTSANCTVGTASYMSPEQCRGERDLTPRSDLYSLGIVLYELATGRKPFSADNAMEMFLAHVQGTFAKPSRFVFDLPPGWDDLICQLLAKKPDDRPRNAQAVADKLAEIRDKVAAQKSAALEEARKRQGDKAGERSRPDEEDRKVARYLLRGKVRGRRKKKSSARDIRIRAAILGLLLFAAVTTLFLVLRRPGGGSNAATAQGRAAEAERAEDEDLLRRYLMHRHGVLQVQAQTVDQRNAFRAVEDEDDGKLDQAREKWQELLRDGVPRWQRLARGHMELIDAANEYRDKLLAHYKDIRDRAKELPLKDPRDQKAFDALRFKLFEDRPRAHARFRELRGDLKEAIQKDETPASPEQHVWFLFASREIHDLLQKGDGCSETTEPSWVRRQLEKARNNKTGSELDRKAAYLNIIALYSTDAARDLEMRKVVDEAKRELNEQP
jgi:predicted Ser/Thr protein kinase